MVISCLGFGQVKNTHDYIPLTKQDGLTKVFKAGNNTFEDYFIEGISVLNGKEYFIKVRKYSWGSVDTSYYREDELNYYHFDKKNGKESIVMPKNIIVGHTWLEADSSWYYEVSSINEVLQTPSSKYTDVVVLKCMQMTNRDKNKGQIYFIYYAKDFGMVGSASNGKLHAWLSEVRKEKPKGKKK